MPTRQLPRALPALGCCLPPRRPCRAAPALRFCPGADGSQFMVDGTGALGSIPERYRGEVQQQLETLQRLTAMALGGKLI
jgi:hypothetical protein